MKNLGVRFQGRLSLLSEADRQLIIARATPDQNRDVGDRVSRIITQVRERGSDALLSLTRELDGVEEHRIEVPAEQLAQARDALTPALRAALERAVANLETVHRAQLPACIEVESEPGVVIGRRWEPLAAVGVYAPGGRAAYPSSVLMGVVPARIAGVRDIVVCSPPGPNGVPSGVVLAAACLAGASRVFALGGAQAIAAMALGVCPVPLVMRIVGPGNAYVAEAKRQLQSIVAIDAPAGPSEILVIADDAADPTQIARELLAQAEHDPDASVVALVLSDRMAAAVMAALRADSGGPTFASIERALAARGAVLTVAGIDEALEFAEAYAAEHLSLQLRDAAAVAKNVRNAGTTFVGGHASVAFGDYLTGANHVLPTAGAAKTYSGLSSLEFVRFTSYQRVTREAARRMADDAALLAMAEGLPAHAAAARGASGENR